MAQIISLNKVSKNRFLFKSVRVMKTAFFPVWQLQKLYKEHTQNKAVLMQNNQLCPTDRSCPFK